VLTAAPTLTGADHGALNLARVEIQMSWVPIPPTRFDENTTSSPSLRTFGWMSFAAASFKLATGTDPPKFQPESRGLT